MNRSKLYLLLLVTILAFPALGLLIDWLSSTSNLYLSLTELKSPYFFQLLTGFTYGLFSGYAAVKLIKRPSMGPTLKRYLKAFPLESLKKRDVVAIGLAAGVGEELLFRSTIQPHLGIWITAIVFVAVHGYLNPKNRPLMVYGLVMTIMVAGLGWLAQYVGIYASIIAHAVIDMVIIFAFFPTRSGKPGLGSGSNIDP